jgi:hypothetical protein
MIKPPSFDKRFRVVDSDISLWPSLSGASLEVELVHPDLAREVLQKYSVPLDSKVYFEGTLVLIENQEEIDSIAVFIDSNLVGWISGVKAKASCSELQAHGGLAFGRIEFENNDGIFTLHFDAFTGVTTPDWRAVPFLNLSYIHNIFEDTDSAVNLAKGRHLVFLRCEDTKAGGSCVSIYEEFKKLVTIDAEANFDLFDAVLEVNQRAWTTIEAVESETKTLECRFAGPSELDEPARSVIAEYLRIVEQTMSQLKK